MTVSEFLSQKEGRNRISGSCVSLVRSACSALPLLLLLVFLIRAPETAATAAREGLLRAGTGILPVLFPFLVLSAYLAEGKGSEAVGRWLGRPFSALFGVTCGGSTAILLGLFCGFPIGARITARLFSAGRIDATERDLLLFLSSGPSFLFLYSAVGIRLYGSARIGLSLYLSSVLSTLLVGFLASRRQRGAVQKSVSVSALPQAAPSGLSRLPSSLASAVSASLGITGATVFFSVIGAALHLFLAELRAPEALSVLLAGLLEFSTGIQNAAETVGGLCGRMLCGCFAGFGGLCAHLQVIATAEDPLPDRADRSEKTPSFRSYIGLKLISGALSALLFPLLSGGFS